MFGRRVTLFKLLGFEVRVDASWLIIAVLITWSLATQYYPSQYKGSPVSNIGGWGSPVHWACLHPSLFMNSPIPWWLGAEVCP